MRNCLTDEGRPLGTGLQGQVSNHLRRLWSKAMVVSTEGKGLARTRSGDRQEEDRKGTTMERRKRRDDVKTAGVSLLRDQSSDETCLRPGAASGVKGGLSLP